MVRHLPASEALDMRSLCRTADPAADMKALKAELERVLSNRQGSQQRFQQRAGLPLKAEELAEELRYATNCSLQGACPCAAICLAPSQHFPFDHAVMRPAGPVACMPPTPRAA